ncbi:MAG: MFS transporter [Lachnospiraceae bacterium]|nr:MFS transporter [Lachnospiraceae bacterium]
MKKLNTLIKELHSFLILWITQSLSSLGSSMTNFALVIWSYQEQGSALSTALLSVCSYAPYVIMSIFAGALSDKWNKKITMLVSDSVAALCTVVVMVLLLTGRLEIWHLYVLNGINGLMNTIQQPAADVTITLLTPSKHYQKVSGFRSFSNSLNTILTPVLATAILAFWGLQAVIWIDLVTFVVAFFSLVCFIKIPQIPREEEQKETVLQSAFSGLRYLKENRGILDLILFLAAINFIASIYDAALPAMILSKADNIALGTVNTVIGIATLAGSILVSLVPEPKSRVRVICNTLLLSMSTENFVLAFADDLPLWCVGAFLGWISIPIMNANMDVIFREKIPVSMQGRVFSARNTLQFFTIPLGLFLGGALVDTVFEPLMAKQAAGSLLTNLFGMGKGSGAQMLFFLIGIVGVIVCLVFRRDSHIWALEDIAKNKE